MACSCARDGDPRAELARADAAFVGRLSDRRPAGEDGSQRRDAAHLLTFRVEESIKGRLGPTVRVRTASDGGRCGLGLGVGQRIGLLLYRERYQPDERAWRAGICDARDPRELREARRPLPRPNGSGPVAFLVGGRFGPARLLALDWRGRTLAYGFRGATRSLSVCPGSKRFVEMADVGRTVELVIRDVRTLRIARTVRLPLQRPSSGGEPEPERISCRDVAGADILVFETGLDRNHRGTHRIRRVRRQSIRTIDRGNASQVQFTIRYVYLLEEASWFSESPAPPARVIQLDLRTGRKRTAVRTRGYLESFEVSPDGLSLAAVVYSAPLSNRSPPSKLVLFDLFRGGSSMRSRPLGGFNVSGEVRWMGNQRLVFLPGGADSDYARVFDRRLRQLGLFGGWYTSRSAVYRGIAYGISGSDLLAAKLPRGPVMRLRRLPSSAIDSLAVVPQVVGARSSALGGCGIGGR